MRNQGRRIRLAAGAVALYALCASGSHAAGLGGFVHRTDLAPYTYENTIIRLHFNISDRIVFGDETAVVRPKRTLSVLPFNTEQIRYERVTVNGQAAAFYLDERNQLINVRLRAPAKAGSRLTVDFRYTANPKRGLYFVLPDKSYPKLLPQIWTQGEPADNRRWFPTWDEPNDKTPSELIVTVPHGWTVVGNGYLKSHATRPAAETWDWASPLPKSTYLIAFAAGEFVKRHNALGKLDVDSFVAPPLAQLSGICFDRTKDMIAYYQRVTGVAYPFEKYDQIATERFDFGGMEDASNTIVSDVALHPKIEDVENSCDSLVSHELAQHWYGDDATMGDWSNAWLNEGFATYYDELWTAERSGVPDFEYARYTAQQAYFAETRQYMRPIVDYVYRDPLQIFDASGHQRPAQVLHMLRTMFGDARFFKAVHTYLREFQYKNADTNQFFASIDQSLGTDLTWFRNEWFYRASYPHYYVSDSYDAGNHKLLLHVEQRNPDGRPFRMPIVIEAFSGSRVARIEPVIDENEQDVVLSGVPAKPDMVLFDPDNNVLRQLTFDKTVDELAYQVSRARHVGDREWALQQLGAQSKATGPARSIAAKAVGRAVTSDPFWGMRADAAGVAAAFDDSAAVEEALSDRDVRVRIAAETAAGSLQVKPDSLAETLERMTHDPNPDVAAAALTSIGQLRLPGAFERLVDALAQGSFQQAIAAGALAGLAGDCDARGFALIKARTSYGTQEQERAAAVQALAQCAAQMKNPQLALGTLTELVGHDPLVSTRIAAANALAALGDKAAIPALKNVESNDSQELVRENAEAALSSLSADSAR